MPTITKCKNREEWLATRRIGASSSAAVIGATPFQSKYALACEMLGKVAPPDLSGNDPVVRGTVLEPYIRGRVGEELEGDVAHDGEFTVLASEEYPFMTATLDGTLSADLVQELFENHEFALPIPEAGSTGTLQIKTVGKWVASEWETGWPLHYQTQCQHELIVSGLEWGVLACLVCADSWVLLQDLINNGFDKKTLIEFVDKQPLKLIPFVRNQRFCTALIKACRQFWELIERGELPDPDGSPSTLEALRRMYPEDDGAIVTLPADALAWAKDYQAIKARKKELVAEEKEIQAKLIEAMGAAEVGEILGSDVDFTYKTTRRKSIDSKALKDNYPDVHKAVSKPITYRTLRTRQV